MHRNRHLFVSLRIQKRSRAWNFGFFAVCIVLVFYWRPGALRTCLPDEGGPGRLACQQVQQEGRVSMCTAAAW